ncbi:topoisomerase DNA-binding C4 zinc finger domain-containing protein [Candidatus Endomicrobiellum devescovinae]|nr:topoisomerase DNA-binding C4 zinc finger domain-containing protein [Endomicrobium sp.]
MLCPDCFSGFLVERDGKYRKFLGCTNFRDCCYTLNPQKHKISRI